MKILLCSDDNYAKHMATTMVSIIENCPLKLDFVVMYVSMELSTIKRLIAFFNSKVKSLEFIEVSRDKLVGIPLPDMESHFTISTYLRLFAPVFLSNEEAVLYLDSDMVVRDDISKLMNLEIVKNLEFPLYAVEEQYAHLVGFEKYQLKLGLSLDEPLLNGGLLIFNIQQWIKSDYLGKILKFIENQNAPGVFVDQDALNSIFRGKWAPLPIRWNMGDTQFNPMCKPRFKFYNVEEVDQAINNPANVHFTWIMKPWKYITKHAYKSEYWNYRKLTPWPDCEPEDKTLATVISKHSPVFLKRAIGRMLKLKK